MSCNPTKPTNPKDALSVDRVPMHLFPRTAIRWGAMAFHEGQLKYDPYNWREAGIRASVYYGALQRHMDAWWDGEDVDPKSGLPHLAKALACIAIMIDAQEVPGEDEMFVDDRPTPGGYARLLEELTPLVAEMREKIQSEHHSRTEEETP